MNPLIKSVKATIAKYGMLDGGETVLVGVSGGPDSVALLSILKKISPDFGLKLHVFHLDHMMRGPAGLEDSEFVRELADEMGLPVSILTADVPAYIAENKLSPEDGARRVRRELLYQVADDIGADRVALGHNADDRVETYLMRMVRGAGLDGLKSIPQVSGMIIRPLIETPRDFIEDYCEDAGLVPRRDLTNEDPSYLRNKVRHELIPYLEAGYNPGLREELKREMDAVGADLNALEALAETAWEKIAVLDNDLVRIDRAAFLRESRALRRRVLRRAALELAGYPQPLNFTHAEDIMAKVAEGESGARLSLPAGLSAEREYDTIVIRISRGDLALLAGDFLPVDVPENGIVDIPELDVAITAETAGPEILDLDAGLDTAFLDASVLEGSLMARPRRPGDRFRPFGMKGTKKLKDLFIDDKIPRQARAAAFVVESAGKIVWLPGYTIDDSYKVTADTTKVLVLKVLRGRS